MFYFICFFIIASLMQTSKAQYDICNAPSLITEASGSIKSPNYPSDYGNYLSCTTKIIAPEGKAILVSFMDFDVELSTNCKSDQLKIYDGTVLYTSKGFCGNIPPRNFLAHNSIVKFVFTTDFAGSEKGFSIRWTSRARCSSNEFTCWDGNCIPLTQQCNGIRHCVDDSDEIECALSSETSAECGKPSVAPHFLWDTKIVGGNEQVPGSWPWQVLLNSRSGVLCGGSILSSEWIITAAHCFEIEESVTVYAGVHAFPPTTGLQKRAVRIINHEEYHSSSKQHDIALIKLNSPLDFGTNIRPICLPEDTDTFDIPPGTTCVTTGWGTLSSNHDLPSALHQVRVPIVDQDECRNSYSALLETQICAGDYTKGGVDSCQGDSGGPLVCFIGESTWFLIGVTSFGRDCAQANFPGVYTRVAKYNSWIRKFARITSPAIPVNFTTPTTNYEHGSEDASSSFQPFYASPHTTIFTVGFAYLFAK